jgi:hypothetical protein
LPAPSLSPHRRLSPDSIIPGPFNTLTGDPGIFLQQITIDLSPTDVRFDTAAGGFGSLGYQDVGGFVGTDATTGLSSISANGAALDGGSLLTFTFANFALNDTFTFSADVDHPNPTLQPLANCNGLKPGPKLLCNLSNDGITASNDALLVAADTVLSAQLSTAQVTFQFGGPGYETTSVTDPLQAATLRSIIDGLQNGDGGSSFASTTAPTTDVVAPEPFTVAAPLIGLAFFGLVWRRQRLHARR